MSVDSLSSVAQVPLIVVLGPTAAGKTALSLELADRLGAEIVSADSRQVYLGLDIGTAKVSAAEQGRTPHHLIDVVRPDEPFGLGDYHRLFAETEHQIRDRGRVPLLVGGSGQYVWSVVEGWSVPRVAPVLEFREVHLKRARREGPSALHAELAQLDPESARSIHPNNVRRVVRALEILRFTGERASSARAKNTPMREVVIIGVGLPRSELYARVDARVEAMFRKGLVEEVEGLLAAGYDASLPSMSGIGYTQVVQFLRGELTLPEAIAHVKSATHRYVRQQAAWFRADDVRIHWCAPGDVQPALQLIGRARDRSAGASAKGGVA
jgi:tRNA dimethylallyltransferase